MPSHLPAQSIRVLLVEDDPDDQWLIADLVTRLDGGTCTVDVAGSMAQAVALLAENRHDVALIDYQLGALSGLDLLQSSADDPARPPMILLTGYGTEDLDRRALAAGAADYLVKGQLSAEQLARTIRYALERHRLAQQLARREQEYRLLFATNPIPLWTGRCTTHAMVRS